MVVDPAGRVLTELGAGEGGWPWPTCVAGRLGEVRAGLPVLSHRRFNISTEAVTPGIGAHRPHQEGVSSVLGPCGRRSEKIVRK